MRTQRSLPSLYLVFQQQNQYQKHIRNLHNIKSKVKKGRPQQSFTERLQEHKKKKEKDFMERLLKEKRRIKQENEKMHQRLAKATFIVPSRLERSHSSISLNKTLSKMRSSQIKHENYSMFNRIIDCNPTIDARRMNQQYLKTKKLREGLTKFDTHCQLKLKKYLRSGKPQNSRFSRRFS